MSWMPNVTITIYQSETLIDTLTTDSDGQADTTLNAGVYIINITYPNRTPFQLTLTLDEPTEHLVFAFPQLENTGATMSSTCALTQEGDLNMPSSLTHTTTIAWTNS